MNRGVDLGRGNVKVACGNKRIIFESYCDKGRTLDFENEKEDYIVTINKVSKYFVGSIAKREGLSRGFQKHKIDKVRTFPLILTGIFLSTDSKYIQTNIVTGAPLSDYKQQKDEIESYINGSYEIEISNRGIKEIEIQNVKVFPEGAGAYFSMILNDNGEVYEKDLASQKVGIVDIGYKTFNLVVFENMKFIDKMSATFPFGMHQAFNMVYKRLSRTEDITPEMAENITTGVEFETLANRIQTEINKFWGNTAFKIFLCGGGAYLLKQYFPKFTVIKEPEFANAEGYYKIAQMLFKSKNLVWKMPQ